MATTPIRTMEERPDGRTLVMDYSRQQAAASLGMGYHAADMSPDHVRKWVDIEMAGTRRLCKRLMLLAPLVAALAILVWDVDKIGAVVGVLSFWLLVVVGEGIEESRVTSEYTERHKERYDGITAKIVAEAPDAPPERAVKVTKADIEDDTQRLHAELRYALRRAYHKPASPRGNEVEVIPVINVTLDARLYRFLMYILRELELVTGGLNADGRTWKKWRTVHKSETEGLAQFEKVKDKVTALDLAALMKLADVKER